MTHRFGHWKPPRYKTDIVAQSIVRIPTPGLETQVRPGGIFRVKSLAGNVQNLSHN